MKNGPYELVVAPEGYSGKKYRGRYAYEHHVVWWAWRGSIPKGYEIHHRNGDHRDNRLKNVQLLTSDEHRAVHSDLQRKPLVQLKCPTCRGPVQVKPNNYRFHRKRGRKHFFCSRSCSARFIREK
jgi:hypothetical protein